MFIHLNSDLGSTVKSEFYAVRMSVDIMKIVLCCILSYLFLFSNKNKWQKPFHFQQSQEHNVYSVHSDQLYVNAVSTYYGITNNVNISINIKCKWNIIWECRVSNNFLRSNIKICSTKVNTLWCQAEPRPHLQYRGVRRRRIKQSSNSIFILSAL